MNLSISNIAWRANEGKAVHRLMNKYGFEGLEIAPPEIWKQPIDQISASDIRQFLHELEVFRIQLVAFQALLFGKEDLRIFGSHENRNATLQYLKKNIILAGRAGARILVFGATRNRDTGNLSPDSALQVACDFFLELGKFAQEHDTIFCVEPNPREYNTNFINNTEDALRLVSAVNHPGFRLHVDTGAMIMNGEPAEEVIRKAFDFMAHLHISEPFLAPVIPVQSANMHREISSVLRELNYKGWISIEMKKNKEGNNLSTIEEALHSVAEIYA